MLEFREIQLKLLKELDKICRDNDIPYILSGHTAYEAEKSGLFPKNITVPTIAMRFCDAKRLISLIDSTSVSIESFLSNRRISRKVMRCSDKNTTYFRVDDFQQYHYHGICVDIEIIRSVSSGHLVNRLCVYLDALFMMVSEMRMNSIAGKILLALFIPLEKLILNIMYTVGSRNSETKLRIPRFPKKSPEFSSSYLLKRKEIELAGEKFYVSEDMQGYLKAEFDNEKEWKNSASGLEDLHLTVIDADTPYSYFNQYMRSEYKKIPRRSLVKDFYIRGRLRFLRQKIEKYWSLLLFTGERFGMWKKYMPQKQSICRLYSEGEDQKVLDMLSDYISSLEKYEKMGFALCFDPDIFEIVLQIFDKNGKQNVSKRLRDLVFSQHLKPIIIEEVRND